MFWVTFHPCSNFAKLLDFLLFPLQTRLRFLILTDEAQPQELCEALVCKVRGLRPGYGFEVSFMVVQRRWVSFRDRSDPVSPKTKAIHVSLKIDFSEIWLFLLADGANRRLPSLFWSTNHWLTDHLDLLGFKGLLWKSLHCLFKAPCGEIKYDNII